MSKDIRNIHQIISEGSVKFYASKSVDGKISKELEVFYNPVMKFNRDVTILLLNSLKNLELLKQKNGIKIADIMAGSGVRSLRILNEFDKIKSIHINDYDKDFLSLIKKNLELNNLLHLENSESSHDQNKISVCSMDANKFLNESKGFDYIDIDPFGSPNPFLDSAINKISRNGILAVTATDTAPLCGTYHNACLRKYWSKPLRNYLMHEVGLRILIRKVQLIGTQYEKALIPIYSYSKDHYFRIFFISEFGKEKCDKVLSNHIFLNYCDKCFNIMTSEKNNLICSNCNTLMNYSGPLWGGKLFDHSLSLEILKLANNTDFMKKSEIKFLEIISEESKLDFLGFLDIHEIAKKNKLTIPNFEIVMSEISKKGFKSSRTIFSNKGIKSDISTDLLFEIIKKHQKVL